MFIYILVDVCTLSICLSLSGFISVNAHLFLTPGNMAEEPPPPSIHTLPPPLSFPSCPFFPFQPFSSFPFLSSLFNHDYNHCFFPKLFSSIDLFSLHLNHLVIMYFVPFEPMLFVPLTGDCGSARL